MSDVNQINALSQAIRRIDGNHTMGAGALAEAILECRTEWDTPRIIRTVTELEAEDPDTVVMIPGTDSATWNPRDLIRFKLQGGTPLPAVVIRDGADVRAARKALEET